MQPVPQASPEATGAVAARFADTARRLGAAARAADLEVPAFRSPPRVPGTTRSIRRYPGGVVVSVQLRGRSFAAVVADMVEGVLVANRLAPDVAMRFRTVLSEALGADDVASPDEARVVERQTRAA